LVTKYYTIYRNYRMSIPSLWICLQRVVVDYRQLILCPDNGDLDVDYGQLVKTIVEWWKGHD
jgi:hypothetical protein